MTLAVDSGSRSTSPRSSALVWWNAVFFTLLCVSEVGFMAAALDWGVTGLFHLPTAFAVVFGAILGGAVLFAGVVGFRMALAAERDLARDG